MAFWMAKTYIAKAYRGPTRGLMGTRVEFERAATLTRNVREQDLLRACAAACAQEVKLNSKQ